MIDLAITTLLLVNKQHNKLNNMCIFYIKRKWIKVNKKSSKTKMEAPIRKSRWKRPGEKDAQEVQTKNAALVPFYKLNPI